VNKRLVIFGVLLAALLLSAVSPWPSVLTVNNWTGDNIYLTLKYRGEQKYFLTATHVGNSDFYNVSIFDIVRRTYSAQVTACETTTVWGRMNLNANLRLSFTPCESMKQWWTPKYWGEPGMEKPNFWNTGVGGVEYTPPDWGWWGSLKYKNPNPPFTVVYGKRAFRFLYDVIP